MNDLQGSTAISGVAHRKEIQTTQTTHVTRPKILKINWKTELSGWVSGLTFLKIIE